MPYSRFVALNSVAIIYLIIQTDRYPIANFHEHSIFSIIILFLFLGAVLIVGYLNLRKTKL
jgi:hypothetical protein